MDLWKNLTKCLKILKETVECLLILWENHQNPRYLSEENRNKEILRQSFGILKYTKEIMKISEYLKRNLSLLMLKNVDKQKW